MASIKLTGNLILNPQSVNSSARQVKQALGRITGQASEFQKSLDASTARVFAFGATTAVIQGVAQSFKLLVSNTINVEKRMIEINAIFQQSEQVMSRFRESIFSVAQSTGQSFDVVSDAAAELARQGLSAEETAGRLEAALILARISGLGAEASVRTLTAAINGFTTAALTAEQVTNKIVAVDTKFAVSADDLAQALARAGSTAEDAGVSFDELLGLVTAVEQRTARGGAVIGNAFKSIFTRLSRGSTIEELKELGVAIDSSQTGIQKLSALSLALDGISDPTKASKIKELAGGVFQINVVSAALKDLSNETSVFSAATEAAAGATNNAYKRNEELNASIGAQINSLVQGVTNLAEKIGGVTFAPLLTNLIGVASKISEVLNNALDPEQGSSIVKGLFKGIGSFLSGPGLVLITSAFLKITKLVAKFAVEGFRTLMSMSKEADKVKSIEGGIVKLLGEDAKLRKVLESTTISQADKQKAIIASIERENKLLTEQKNLVSTIAQIAAARGVTGYTSGGGFSGKGGKTYASGHLQEEYKAKMLGATSSVKAHMGKGTIGGRKFIMNDQEIEIPNFGRNGDSAVIPQYAEGNMPQVSLRKFIDGNSFTNINQITQGIINGTIKAAQIQQGPLAPKWPKSPPYRAKPSAEEINSIKAAAVEEKNKQNKASYSTYNANKPKSTVMIVPQKSPLQPNSMNTHFKSQPRNVGGHKVDQFIGGHVGLTEITDRNKERYSKILNIDKVVRDNVARAGNESLTHFYNEIGQNSFQTKPSNIKGTQVKKLILQEGGKGAYAAVTGAIFEGIMVAMAGDIKADNDNTLDVDFKKDKTGLLDKIFGTNGRYDFADFKASSKSKETFMTQVLSNLPHKTHISNQKLIKAEGRFADGYIPNYAGGSGALSEAIEREKAAGIPKSRIRVEQDRALMNNSNPRGLAVTNTIDEPNGLKDVFASGFIPNYAAGGGSAPPAAAPKERGINISTLFAVQMGVSMLNETLTSGARKAKATQDKELEAKAKALKKTIEKSELSEEAKQKEIDSIDKKLEADRKAIEGSKTLSESFASISQKVIGFGLTIAQLGSMLPQGIAGKVGGKIKNSRLSQDILGLGTKLPAMGGKAKNSRIGKGISKLGGKMGFGKLSKGLKASGSGLSKFGGLLAKGGSAIGGVISTVATGLAGLAIPIALVAAAAGTAFYLYKKSKDDLKKAEKEGAVKFEQARAGYQMSKNIREELGVKTKDGDERKEINKARLIFKKELLAAGDSQGAANAAILKYKKALSKYSSVLAVLKDQEKKALRDLSDVRIKIANNDKKIAQHQHKLMSAYPQAINAMKALKTFVPADKKDTVGAVIDMGIRNNGIAQSGLTLDNTVQSQIAANSQYMRALEKGSTSDEELSGLKGASDEADKAALKAQDDYSKAVDASTIKTLKSLDMLSNTIGTIGSESMKKAFNAVKTASLKGNFGMAAKKAREFAAESAKTRASGIFGNKLGAMGVSSGIAKTFTDKDAKMRITDLVPALKTFSDASKEDQAKMAQRMHELIKFVQSNIGKDTTEKLASLGGVDLSSITKAIEMPIREAMKSLREQGRNKEAGIIEAGLESSKKDAQKFDVTKFDNKIQEAISTYEALIKDLRSNAQKSLGTEGIIKAYLVLEKSIKESAKIPKSVSNTLGILDNINKNAADSIKSSSDNIAQLTDLNADINGVLKDAKAQLVNIRTRMNELLSVTEQNSADIQDNADRLDNLNS